MLNVYRASAGSGKTHLLAGTYLKMLFQAETSFENILAVTFTNKATEEMKERIIQQLYALAHDPQKSDYLDDISKSFNLPLKAVQEKAKKTLIAILHNYSKYNVSTIDRFFQQVMRAFTREVGLQGGYRIELDDASIRQRGVELMMDSLQENQELLLWLKRFSQEKLQEGEHWDIKADLLALSREITKEEYRKNSDELLDFTADKKNLRSYIDELQQIRNLFLDTQEEIAKRALGLLKEYQLEPSEINNGKNGLGPFGKWVQRIVKEPTSTVHKLNTEVSAWYKKTTSSAVKDKIEQAYHAGLHACIVEMIELYDTLMVYQSAEETLKYIYSAGILSDIDRQMRAYCREQNILLISDTTELLGKIIDGSDNPFIYEKIGTHLRHFMIDEFQDTSGMQWDNFKPLLTDSLAEDLDNLIVGDVKQSIYRWRSSDWMLLHHHIRNFANDQRQDKVLNTNWRSASHIIGFNNSFFLSASALLQSKYNKEGEVENQVITEAYEDICQHVSPRNKDFQGHVKVQFFENTTRELEDGTEEDISWKTQALEHMVESIKTLQDKGYALKDIAILVRKSTEGVAAVTHLLQYKAAHPDSNYRFDVISNEALYISQSDTVRTLVSFMKFLINPKSKVLDTLTAYHLLKNYSKLTADQALEQHFLQGKDANSILLELFGQEIKTLAGKPLYDLVEEIINLVSPADQSDLVYTQAFQDLVLDYMVNNSADLAAFLAWWDEDGVRKAVSSPDSQDAIQVITVHKSKGLGFKAVILPFASWTIDHGVRFPVILWTRPQQPPFNKLPLVPIKYGKTLANTIYKNDYLNERLQTFIDNLNVAYVAFTRAEEEMIIFAEKPKRPENLSTIGEVLYAVFEYAKVPSNQLAIQEKMLTPDLNEKFDPETWTYEAGDWVIPKKKQNPSLGARSVFGHQSTDPSNRLQLRLYGKGFFNDTQERIYGNLMHDILSKIKYPNEVEEAIQKEVFRGVINQDQALEVRAKLEEALQLNDLVKSWFSPQARVYNETDILLGEGSFLRPDRIVEFDNEIIVIDYKFGHKEYKKYHKQVAHYMQLISKMGFKKPVKGYLWYVEMKKVELVGVENQATLF